MRKNTTAEEYDDLPYVNKLFWTWYKEEMGLAEGKECSFQDIFELALSLTNDLHFDTSIDTTGRYSLSFNNVLNYDELLFAWEGKDPLGTLWFELNIKLRERIIKAMALAEVK